MKHRRIHGLLAALLALAAGVSLGAQTKPHQATGTVISAAPAKLVIRKQFGRNTVHWTFLLNPKTRLDGKPSKGARVRIYYHEEKGQRVAERIKIVEPAPGAVVIAPEKSPPVPPAQ